MIETQAIIAKELEQADFDGLPCSWRFIADQYDGVRAAAKEMPPAYNMLKLAVYQALVLRDRVLIDEAVELVGENVPEDALLSLTGMAVYSLGFREEGLGRLRKVLESHPSVAGMLALGDHLEAPGEFYEKLKLASSVLTTNPRDPDALRQAAFVLVHFGRLSEARECARRAIDVHPISSGPIETLGEIAFRRRKYSLALKHYRRAAKRSEGRYRLRLLQQITCCYYYLGKFRRAKESALAMRHVASKELGVAEDDERHTSWLDELEGRRRHGIEFFERDCAERAAPLLKAEALTEVPPGKANLYSAAIESMTKKDFRYLQRAIDRVEDRVSHDVVLTVTGRTLFEIGDVVAGIAQLRRAVTMGDTVFAKFNLGHCLSLHDATAAEASELLANILADDPSHCPAACDLARIAGNSASAIALYERACANNLDDWRVYYELGTRLFSFGEFREAVKAYERARRITDKNPALISLAIARSLEAAGDVAEARRNAERAVFEDPGLHEAHEVLLQVNREGQPPVSTSS